MLLLMKTPMEAGKPPSAGEVTIRVFVCEAEVLEEAPGLKRGDVTHDQFTAVKGSASTAAAPKPPVELFSFAAAAEEKPKASKRAVARPSAADEERGRQADAERRGRPKVPVHLSRLFKGSWSENKFESVAIALGFTPFRSWMGHAALDFILEWRGKLLRIQVKSAWELHRYHYFIPTRRKAKYRGDLKPYGNTIDFLAAYVPPLDIWYIVPADKINLNTKGFCVYPLNGDNPRDKNGNKRRRRLAFDYEVYREAWNLLKAACR